MRPAWIHAPVSRGSRAHWPQVVIRAEQDVMPDVPRSRSAAPMARGLLPAVRGVAARARHSASAARQLRSDAVQKSLSSHEAGRERSPDAAEV